jgi:transcriptional regulator with XRE-family HTH domain
MCLSDITPDLHSQAMTDASAVPTSDAASPAQTVREILEEARRVAGSGTRLAAQLEALGIGPPDTNRYSESAISNWIRGRTMPPADVLVAASQIAGHPFGRAADTGHAGMADLQAQVDALRAAVIDLYGRLGYQMPNLDRPADSDVASQKSAAVS